MGVKGDLEPGQEEEEHEADLGEDLERRVDRHDVEHLRPDQDPGQDVDDYGRDRGQPRDIQHERREGRRSLTISSLP